ncbi:hypothetical protein BHU72_13695 [Desulfuribacillus stibiiarsenatis]|uniref:PBP domain-containing protein n=1 Tax=Desulfuribacillus stibiiarsenatis TaxID=1390249 RepID=A0A1E5L820_9FIRM|nr:phosphate ABC transporter substrate-binding protein [Desulfuribacillus stibiiarsenatis]OEH86276.1 hypothetical protein BHU72_13695 [Desulfuribacillus stibiiarsenatis]
MKKISITAFLIVTLLLIICHPIYGQANKIDISGSSTMLPFITEIAELHKEIQGIDFSISAGGSGTGVKNTISGTSHIGMASRVIKAEEKQQLADLLVGLDTIVFVVNERNPVNEINKQQLIQIYSDGKTSWEQFGGEKTPIFLVSKEIGRATLELFEEFTGLKSPKRKLENQIEILDTAIEVGANIEVATLVGGIPNAIGYLSLGTAIELQEKGMPIKILKLEGVEANVENVVNGSYPILRELNVVYRDANELQVRTLLDLLLSEQGQAIIEKHSFIPVR